MNRENPIFEQPDLVAYLTLYHKTIPEACVKNGRVFFQFPGQDMTKGLSSWFANNPVPVQDFCRTLKTIKTLMFNTKIGVRR